MKQLDNGLAISLQKCDFAESKIELLGVIITPSGITPLITKTEDIMKLDDPKTLKQLRSFLGSVHQFSNFLPNLDDLSEPLRPLLKKNPESKNNKLDWKDEYSSIFNKVKIENTHFDPTKQTSVKCDTSVKRFGASIEQKNKTEWHKMAFASRFLDYQPDIAQTN